MDGEFLLFLIARNNRKQLQVLCNIVKPYRRDKAIGEKIKASARTKFNSLVQCLKM